MSNPDTPTPTPTPVSPAVAAFDFDGTLTHGGSVWRFLAAMVGPRRVVLAGLSLLPRFMLGAVLGGRWTDDAKEALFVRTLAGLDAAVAAERAAVFGRSHYQRRAREDVRSRLEWHRRHGHRLVIVSASPESYIEAVGRELGVDGVLATRLAVAPDGRLTGHYEGRNCRGSEKLARLRAWMADNLDAPASELWAYGNSAGDRALLHAADVGVNVGALGRAGTLRRFRRLGSVAGDRAGD